APSNIASIENGKQIYDELAIPGLSEASSIAWIEHLCAQIQFASQTPQWDYPWRTILFQLRTASDWKLEVDHCLTQTQLLQVLETQPRETLPSGFHELRCALKIR